MDKRGQVTVFIILAVFIVGGIILLYSLGSGFGSDVPAEFRSVYDYYLSCLEETSEEGIRLMGGQGGYIETPPFDPGSLYMPFSSQLDFLGQPVPYWAYVSGNNLLKEQVPTKSSMERELAQYVSSRISDCDFTDFEQQGFDVFIEGGSASVSIQDLSVSLEVINLMTIYFGDLSTVVESHSISVHSKLGRFYELAREIYDYEKGDMFLEAYALDVMRLYAPVTGTEITCAPKVFNFEEIRTDISNGLSTNIASLKLDGSYYDLSTQERNYFVSDAGFSVNENVNFMYSPEWPTRIEIYGDEVVRPVGIQEGLGILGFCYVPYHLVYDITFPVMVQLYDDNEIFQFPVAVIISKNQAREAVPTTYGSSVESQVCEFKNKDFTVGTYDVNLEPVESLIQFKCFDSVCMMGETVISGSGAVWEGQVPRCVNSFIVASAEGYADSEFQVSTNEVSSADIILNKKYGLDLDLGNVERALVSFESESYSVTVLYPETETIELVEGNYDITVQVYDDSSLVFPAINEQTCVDVPESGLSGFLGGTTERCFDANIPAMDISFAIVGGGTTSEYITVGQLEDARELNINIPLFGRPNDIDELQANYRAVEDERIFLEFE